MGNSESRPSPGEDRHRGAHGGNRSAKQAREDETVRSSQAAGKDPGRESTPMRIAPEEHVVRGPRRNKAAIIWEGEPGDRRTLTYFDLYRQVSQFANVLKSLGVVRGDRVALYMPLVPELTIAMLACARIGAVHSVVFGGFSSGTSGM